MSGKENITNKLASRTKKPEIPSIIYGKMAPQAPDLEGAVLGAVMLEPDKIITMMTIISSAEIFYSDANQRIYSCLRRLYDKGSKIDFMTVCADLRKNNELEMVGGSFYVTSLTRDVVSSAHLEEHARIVLQKYALREMIRISGEVIGDAYENSTDVFDLLDESEKKYVTLQQYMTGGQHRTMASRVSKYLDKIHNRDESNTLVRTYFRDLDKIITRLKPGCMYVLAARPGHGKTSVLISSTLQQSKRFPVGVWNGELTEERFINRYISNLQSIDSRQIDELINEGKTDHIVDGTSHLISDHNLLLDCTPNIEIDSLIAKIRYWVFVCGAKVIWLDYINLISVSPEMEKYNSREQQMFHILKKLSAVCKQCDVPLILLGQLNRDVLKQADKIPNLGNLKEAGRIEEMVFFVGFIHRPEEYSLEPDGHGSVQNRMDILVRKHSDGQNNVDIHLNTNMAHCKVYDQEQIEIIWGGDASGTIAEIPFN